MAADPQDKVSDLSLIGDGNIVDADYVVINQAAGPTTLRGLMSSLYTYFKAKLDTAYGNFVTRWPTWSEVTSKPSTFTPDVASTFDSVSLNEADDGTTGASYLPDMSTGTNIRLVEANQNFAFGPSAGTKGAFYRWYITQDSTGSRVATFAAGVWKYSGSLPVLTTTANAVDLVEAIFDGTKFVITNFVADLQDS